MVDKVSTGTTCVGVLFNGGVVLAADRRTTAGYIASDRSSKVYDLSDYIVATTSGHAADNQRVMRHMKGEIRLIELKNERAAKVREAAMILNSVQYSLVRSQGAIVSLIVGGYDKYEGASLYNLSPDGTVVANDGYVADGSGSVFVKGVLDMEYKEGMSEKEAINLVDKAFKASFKNDPNSGGGYIVKVVTEEGIKEISRKIVKSEVIDE